MFRKTRKPATSSSAKPAGLNDTDFGLITIRRSGLSRSIRLRLLPDGTLTATMPKRTPLYLLKSLIDGSRHELLDQVREVKSKRPNYHDGQSVGRSHTLRIKHIEGAEPRGRLAAQDLLIDLPPTWSEESPEAQSFIRDWYLKALKKEARSYLPRRLQYLAEHFGFNYTKIRFGNPKGRWGSYSSSGTISLNVALMNLPLEVVDYVLVHELCHSRHPHHQIRFWQEVEACLPDYKSLRRQLKEYSPYL
ncbi:MAG TPA: SprT family zinc-dependent metalloprotease [Candidatus Saccharimonadales bacterium]|nr:SprT family zinc-dependent metalloprotease [Candidatus Saccharimonadales bacterium]